MNRVNNKAMLRAQEAVDAFVQGVQNDAEKLKAHLAGICVQAASQDQDELNIQVRSAFDVEYNLTGDTEATSELLVALGLKEEDFSDDPFEAAAFVENSNDFECVRQAANILGTEIRPPSLLHVFSNDFEWVIARDMDDVRALFSENPGWSQPDEDDWENWAQAPDEQTHTIWCDAEGKPTEPQSEGSERVTLTNAEWCEKLGRGYLCTTEY